MLLPARAGDKNRSKSKTPTKNDSTPTYQGNSSPRKKREPVKSKQNIKDKKNSNEVAVATKFKTKETYQILHNLESMYSQLTFNEFDIFPIEMINNAKRNIEDLMKYLGHEPTCRYHKDLLNLYCDNDKSVICVSCVYKSPEHKTHKIKSIESVEKILNLETIRCEEKTKNLIH